MVCYVDFAKEEAVATVSIEKTYLFSTLDKL